MLRRKYVSGDDIRITPEEYSLILIDSTTD
jgi:hypothetical protein